VWNSASRADKIFRQSSFVGNVRLPIRIRLLANHLRLITYTCSICQINNKVINYSVKQRGCRDKENIFGRALLLGIPVDPSPQDRVLASTRGTATISFCVSPSLFVLVVYTSSARDEFFSSVNYCLEMFVPNQNPRRLLPCCFGFLYCIEGCDCDR
jgi:hypothetical protein